MFAPTDLPFKGIKDSSALSGISSMRGDYLEKPPLQRRWHAVRSESRANDVRPYDFFGRAFSLGEDAIHAANTHKNEKRLPFVWQSLF